MAQLLTSAQAANYLQVPTRTFLESYQVWRIPVVRLGHRTLRFRPEDLDAFAKRAARAA